MGVWGVGVEKRRNGGKEGWFGGSRARDDDIRVNVCMGVAYNTLVPSLSHLSKHNQPAYSLSLHYHPLYRTE